jgi:hypothetical protein
MNRRVSSLSKETQEKINVLLRDWPSQVAESSIWNVETRDTLEKEKPREASLNQRRTEVN